MVLVPLQSLLPFHFIWISLLLLYGLGYRTYTRTLTWCLLVPVMAGAALLFVDARIRALQPYDELIELPVMVLMLFAITRHTSRRAAAMAALDEVSQHNELLLERQRALFSSATAGPGPEPEGGHTGPARGRRRSSHRRTRPAGRWRRPGDRPAR
jgi:hypothetical protein